MSGTYVHKNGEQIAILAHCVGVHTSQPLFYITIDYYPKYKKNLHKLEKYNSGI